jgi:phosphoribosylformylglycinamidine cyclo-ligase
MAQLSAAGETVYNIGSIRARAGDEHQTIVV